MNTQTKALTDALQALLDWGREHTSPTERNSPHKLLIQAHEALEAAKQAPAPAPVIVITLEGGLVQDVLSTVPVSCFIVDYDCDEEPQDNDKVISVPQGNDEFTNAFVRSEDASVNPARISEITEAIA